MKVEGGLCQLLDWDSEFFGFRIARLRQSELTPLILSDVFDWCDREEVRCLYFLVSAGSSRIIELAEASGFRMADIRITLVRELGANAGSANAGSISRCGLSGNQISPPYGQSLRSVIVIRDSTMISAFPTNDVMSSIKRGSNVPVVATLIPFWLLNIVSNQQVMSPVTSSQEA